MSKSTIAFFEANSHTYIQSINTSTDVVTIHDVDENTILEIDRGARVTDANGAVGDFRIETIEGVDHWVYYENPLRTRIVCGPAAPGDSLLRAEVQMAIRYIERKEAA